MNHIIHCIGGEDCTCSDDYACADESQYIGTVSYRGCTVNRGYGIFPVRRRDGDDSAWPRGGR